MEQGIKKIEKYFDTRQTTKNYNVRYQQRKNKKDIYIGNNKDPRTQKFPY